MTGRNPARLLAPLALLATIVALFAIVAPRGGSGGGEPDGAEPEGSRQSQVGTPTPDAKDDRDREKPKTYRVKPGDTPSGIAEKFGIPLEELLDLNPEMDPQTLNVGDRLRLR